MRRWKDDHECWKDDRECSFDRDRHDHNINWQKLVTGDLLHNAICGTIKDESDDILKKVLAVALEKFKKDMLVCVTDCVKNELSQQTSTSKTDNSAEVSDKK